MGTRWLGCRAVSAGPSFPLKHQWKQAYDMFRTFAMFYMEKTLMLGKIEGRRKRGWQRMRWLDGITNSLDMNSGKTPGDSERQGSLVCCSPWGRNELDTTWQLNNNEYEFNREAHPFSLPQPRLPFLNGDPKVGRKWKEHTIKLV